MNHDHAFWNDVRTRLEGNPGAERHLDRLRKRLAGKGAAGPATTLPEGEAYEKALDMVTAQVETLMLSERLRTKEERLRLKVRDFWLSVYEHTGLALDEPLEFDPGTARIYARRSEVAAPPDSFGATLDSYREILRQVLADPNEAAQKALVSTFPEWLRAVAREVNSGTLKPRLRQLVEQCLDDPEMAQETSALAGQTRMPSWFVELMTVLATPRQRAILTRSH